MGPGDGPCSHCEHFSPVVIDATNDWAAGAMQQIHHPVAGVNLIRPLRPS
jgi:hypothetical protein